MSLEDGGSRLAASTAEAVLAFRAGAAHERDERVRSPDHLAERFLPPGLRLTTLARLPVTRRFVRHAAERIVPGAYWFDVVRTKHMDGLLLDEIAAGARQVIVLGAGFDTRAYRFGERMRGAQVFEVDHPATARVKRERVLAVLGELPGHVSYVEIDFNEEELGERLSRAGLDPALRTFVIWSGVSVYLEEHGVEAVLRFTAGLAAGSSIAFDYVWREVVDGDDSPYGARELRRQVARGGEPLRFGIPRGQTASFLRERGLELVSDLTPDEATARYLLRSDGTVAGEGYGFGGIAHARVA